jgi:hypothetical protein
VENKPCNYLESTFLGNDVLIGILSTFFEDIAKESKSQTQTITIQLTRKS